MISKVPFKSIKPGEIFLLDASGAKTYECLGEVIEGIVRSTSRDHDRMPVVQVQNNSNLSGSRLNFTRVVNSVQILGYDSSKYVFKVMP